MTEQIELDWPEQQRVYLTIDYECDYGTALEENSYEALEYTDDLVDVLESLDVPLTCFIQTEVLEAKPEEVERLRAAGIDVSFHPHSHTHKPRDQTDVEAEVQQSTDAFEEFFGRSPVGYRFPNGNIRHDDYGALAAQGYEFDASVFPSWRPGHFDNRDASLVPAYLPEHELYEIPFTVYSDSVRIPTALSYCRLLGRPFTELLLRRPPSTVIFNIHMHDLVNPGAYERLSPPYRGIYARNPDGLSLLRRVLERFVAAGYQFEQIDDIHEAVDRREKPSA
jgi:peptidoglycan/xylan/chitin deacetylase (PgdA/CDA1 family)